MAHATPVVSSNSIKIQGGESNHTTLQSATLQLPERRQLGYLRCGASEGRPFFYFHGLPGSRYEAMLIDAAAKALDLSITAVDRPGYGLSGFYPERRLTDWPNDVLALADALGIEQFGVIGVSGGGPYALACAHAVADRLTTIGIVCGLGPVYEVKLLRDMKAVSRFAFHLVAEHPDLFKWLYGQPLNWLSKRHPALAVRMLACHIGGVDRPVLLRRDVLESIARSLNHAFYQGPRAATQDMQLYQRPWGFELSDIRKQVHLWHGSDDAVVPCSHSQYVHARLAESKLALVAQQGHFSLPILYTEEILAALSVAG